MARDAFYQSARCPPVGNEGSSSHFGWSGRFGVHPLGCPRPQGIIRHPSHSSHSSHNENCWNEGVQIRSPKTEIRRKPEIRSPKQQPPRQANSPLSKCSCARVLVSCRCKYSFTFHVSRFNPRFSAFGFPSDFGFRSSGFKWVPISSLSLRERARVRGNRPSDCVDTA